MNIITIDHVTKDYGCQRGIFNMSFQIKQGETLGFLGPNGSGKTTTIRHLMGFMKPDSGVVQIHGLACFQNAAQIQKMVGYLPGEMSFIDDMTGIDFIQLIAKLKGMQDLSYAYELMQFLELDAKAPIKRMSKGMKQKIGLVIAFMQNPPILILDEPTSGLDPLMQLKFVELMKQFKQQGKTILMSSHIFEEIENICDRVVIIKAGQIVAIEDMEKLKHNRYKHYEIQFSSLQEANLFMKKYPDARQNECYVSLMLQGHIDDFIKDLSHYKVNDLNIRSQSLEEIFLQYYGE